MLGRPEHDPGRRDAAQENDCAKDNHDLHRDKLSRFRRDPIYPFLPWAQLVSHCLCPRWRCQPMLRIAAVQAALELKIPFDLRPPQNLLKSSTKYPLGCSSSMSDFQWSSQSVERALSTLPLGVGSLVLDTRPLLDKVAIIGRLVGPQKNAADLGSSRRK